jgi:hypothetical protein
VPDCGLARRNVTLAVEAGGIELRGGETQLLAGDPRFNELWDQPYADEYGPVRVVA